MKTTYTTRLIAAMTVISVLSAVTSHCAYASNQDKVVICHIPPGNPDNMHSIEIGEPAVEAHLAHGDIISYCPGDSETSNIDDDISAATATPPLARPTPLFRLRSIQGS